MKCHNHGEYEATFKVTYGRYMDNITFVCELCLLDYEDRFKELDISYRVEPIPEKVIFT